MVLDRFQNYIANEMIQIMETGRYAWNKMYLRNFLRLENQIDIIARTIMLACLLFLMPRFTILINFINLILVSTLWKREIVFASKVSKVSLQLRFIRLFISDSFLSFRADFRSWVESYCRQKEFDEGVNANVSKYSEHLPGAIKSAIRCLWKVMIFTGHLQRCLHRVTNDITQ